MTQVLHLQLVILAASPALPAMVPVMAELLVEMGFATAVLAKLAPAVHRTAAVAAAAVAISAPTPAQAQTRCRDVCGAIRI